MTPNSDYNDMLSCFAEERVNYLLVGAYAMAAHGHPRTTMDIYLWIEPDPGNAEAGGPGAATVRSATLRLVRCRSDRRTNLFQIGVAAVRIDILCGATGLEFTVAAARAVVVQIDGQLVPVLSVPDLITNKLAIGPYQDLADVERLRGRA